ncbi:MAG: PilZ domain-containing protein [Nitrospirota bacterium]
MPDYPKDRRKHKRITLELETELHLDDGAVIKGKIKNISFSGVFMYCINSANMPVGMPGLLKIYLQTGPNPNTINIRCETVRTDESGAGIKFINIDIAGYQLFKNLMIYNSADPDALLAELEKHPGLDIYKGN